MTYNGNGMTRLGIIGTGKMGSALLGGVLDARLLSRSKIMVYDTNPQTQRRCCKQFKVAGADSEAELLGSCQRVLIAIKPQDLGPVLRLAKTLKSRPHTVISVCAGVPIATFKAAFGHPVQVCRAMPNTPAMLRCGATAVSFDRSTSSREKKWLLEFFATVGLVCPVRESLLNAVTGVSGSGPAYAYYVIEALAQAGTAYGIPYRTALNLAAKTMEGAAKMVWMLPKPVTQLIAEVTSKGGTTAAGMRVLYQSSVASDLRRTVAAATARAKVLAKGL